MPLSTSKIYNERLFVRTKKGRLRKHGRLRSAVFHPTKPVLIGFMEKRPDFLWMFKRKPRFIALDSIETDDEGRCIANVTDDEAWDRTACRRLGVDFDECILWDGMPVRTVEGQEVGTISDIAVNAKSGAVKNISISEGTINRALLGSAVIDAGNIRGYSDDAIVVDVTREEVTISGGAAGKAGEAWAKGSHAVAEAEDRATTKAAEAISGSGKNAGKAVGKVAVKASSAVSKAVPNKKSAAEAGKATGEHLRKVGGMFGEFKKEYDKARK